MLNQLIVNGKLPHFEGTFMAGEGDKKSFMSWAISVKRDYKKPDEQYYPEDLINFKAFGAKADFINKFFQKGDGLILIGKLQRDEDYTNKEGVLVKGQLALMVDQVMFSEGTNKNGEGATKTTSSPAATGRPGAGARPAAGARPGARPGANRPF